MKYWRGFLVAGILLVISLCAVWFASAHAALVDMIYPYMTRLIIGKLAGITAGIKGCLWQTVLLIFVLLSAAGIAAYIVLKRNPLPIIGWITAAVCLVSTMDTLLYGLNDYAGPISEDVRLEMTDYTVPELAEAAKYYRDKANALADSVPRNADGTLALPSFEELAVMAGDGFHTLTYERAISLFAGSTEPVKKLGWTLFYKGKTGVTVAITGEACVNPKVPSIALPFAMCKEMSKRMTIAREEDAKYAAFMASEANESELFQYSAYCIAYYHCYNTLLQVPTSTAQQNAQNLHNGASSRLKADMEAYEDFFGSFEDPEGDSLADMLVSAYVQEYITPLHQEEEDPFDPLDKSKVDLEYAAPVPTPLQEKKDD